MKSPPALLPSCSPAWALAVVLVLTQFTAARAAEADALLQRWLTNATNLTSWHAEFTQTRHLKALTQPLASTGQVWFAAPDRFRWELGQPPQSIALRDGAQMLVLAPRLKRAERYNLTAATPGAMRDLMALFDTGFPRDAAEFQRRFTLLEAVPTNSVWAFRLQPRATAARRMLPEMRVEVSTNDFLLTATELTFADGSRMRNDFTNSVKDAPVDAAQFTTNLDATWKVTEPMKR